jgi:HTH-type transcriptional regulator/antitoxin HigA
MTNLDPIETAAEHSAALARIDQLMDAAEGTEEIAELEALAILVEQYEREAFPSNPPSPIDVIRFRMEQMG